MYLILLKVFGVWRKPTFTFAKGRIWDGADNQSQDEYLKGYLHDIGINNVSDVETLVNNSMQ